MNPALRISPNVTLYSVRISWSTFSNLLATFFQLLVVLALDTEEVKNHCSHGLQDGQSLSLFFYEVLKNKFRLLDYFVIGFSGN